MKSESGLTANELCSAASRATHTDIGRGALRRFHREGLLPRPIQVHRQGEPGSLSIYPPGALDQLTAVIELRAQTKTRPFEQLRFEAWWAGLWVEPSLLRSSLEGLLDERTAWIRESRQRYETVEDAVEAMLTQPLRDTRSPIVRLMRRRVRGDENLRSALYALLVLVLGGDPIWETPDVEPDGGPEPHPIELVGQLMGLDRAAAQGLAGLVPSLDRSGLVTALVRYRDSGLLDLVHPSRLIHEATDQQLDAARDRARNLLASLLPFAESMEGIWGRDAAGLGIVRVARKTDWIFVRILFVKQGLAWDGLQLEDAPVDALAQVQPQAELFAAVRREFPQYKQYLAPGGDSLLEELPTEERRYIETVVRRFVDDWKRSRNSVSE